MSAVPATFCLSIYMWNVDNIIYKLCTFFFFFLIPYKEEHTVYHRYKIAGLNQHWCIGILVAKSTADQTESRTTLGTKNILEINPFWYKKFRSAIMVFSCQPGFFFCQPVFFFLLITWTVGLDFCCYLKTKYDEIHGFWL